MVGANLGLTSTALVASIPMAPVARATAVSNFPFNFAGVLLFLPFLGVFPNHQWDVSGPKDISLTTIQPLLSYLPGGGWASSSSGPIIYNWEAEQWTIPLNLMVSRTVKFGHLPVKLALDCNYYLEQADALGQQWMIGFNITPVVPNVVAGWLVHDREPGWKGLPSCRAGEAGRKVCCRSHCHANWRIMN